MNVLRVLGVLMIGRTSDVANFGDPISAKSMAAHHIEVDSRRGACGRLIKVMKIPTLRL
jgi:hypothetical protein